MVADHAKIKRRIAIARGQLDGIMKMIDSDAYCIDISNQLLATIAILKRADNEIITAHLNSCVRNAKDPSDIDRKMKELSLTINRISKL